MLPEEPVPRVQHRHPLLRQSHCTFWEPALHRQLLLSLLPPLRGWKGQSWVKQHKNHSQGLTFLAAGTDTGHDLLAEPKIWAANGHWLGRSLQLLFAGPDHTGESVWIALKGWETCPEGPGLLQDSAMSCPPCPATTRLSEPVQGAKPYRKRCPFFSYSYLNIYNHLVFVSPPTALLVTRLQLFSPLFLADFFPLSE